jgi:GR25 family glycosyltransferase involved in LPS biosynthesis
MNFNNTEQNTFCVSMTRSIDRREHFTNQAKKIGLNFSFFEGVDGDKITDVYGNSFGKKQLLSKTVLMYDNMIFSYTPHNIQQINNKVMSVYQIGSAKANNMLYEKLLKDKTNEYYLLFEDDFIMNDNFTVQNISDVINDLPDNFDVCFFSITHAHKSMLPKKQQITNKLYSVSPFPWFSGTSCYLLSKKGAKKIMSLDGPNIIFAGDDVFSYFSGTDQMEIYSSEISFGWGHDTQKFPSQIS